MLKKRIKALESKVIGKDKEAKVFISLDASEDKKIELRLKGYRIIEIVAK